MTGSRRFRPRAKALHSDTSQRVAGRPSSSCANRHSSLSAALHCTFARFAVQRLSHRAGIARCDTQERERRAIRCSPSLFPIAQSRHADTNHESKLGLRRLERFTNALHVGGSQGGDPSRLHCAAAYLSRLSDAREQLLECHIFHVKSSRTSMASTLSCTEVKSPCSFFA